MTAAGDAPVTSALARFVAATGWDDLPEPVRHAGRRNLLNVAACALGGRRDPAVLAFSAALRPMAGPAAATEIGAGGTDPATAAFLNAVAANVQDFDDQHLPTVMHPGPPIVAAALAAAEMAGANGRRLLTAIVLGIEAGCRIGNAVTPGHYAAGFHITATCGVFGAAVAAARVLGLDGAGVGAALGHAASQAGGIVEALGAATKSTGVGAAARAGLHAAMFAQAGIGGPAAPLEGRFGFLNVLARDARPEHITEALGERWEVLRSAPKAYPVGVVLHPVVDAALALRALPGFDPATLSAIALRGHPLLRLRADRPAVTTGREATVSAQHVGAVAILRGQVGPAELTDEAVADAAVDRLRALFHVVEDAGIAVEGVRLQARCHNGTEHSIEVAIGRGLPDRPLTDEELIAKVSLQTCWGAPWIDPVELVRMIWDVQDAPNLASLSSILRPPDEEIGAATPFRSA